MKMTHANQESETAKLAEENRRLRTHLDELLSHAYDNQQILHRHHEINLKLIAADGFVELVDCICRALPDTFSLDVVTLLIVDPHDEVSNMMALLNMEADKYPNLLVLRRHEKLSHELVFQQAPELGRYDASQHGLLFPAPLQAPESVAIVPLHRHHKLIGFLNFGSLQTDRFAPGMATDFLEVHASMVSICLENAINHERLKHLSMTDPLTGINNRRFVEQRLQEEISLSQRRATMLSCLYIDVDHFKRINDNLGHAVGDEVLREIATRIRRELRISDVLGRFGGEEFVVLLPDTHANDAVLVASRILRGISNEAFHLDEAAELSVTVSIGVSTIPVPDRSQPVSELSQALLTQADSALYRAKSEGRNRIITS